MVALEKRTAPILDIFFCVVLMPLLLLLGPAHHWVHESVWFFVLVCVYMYSVYFVVKAAGVPRLIMRGRYGEVAGLLGILVILNYLLAHYPLPRLDFVLPAMSEYQTRMRNYSVSLSMWLMFSLVLSYALTISFVRELYGQLLRQKRAEYERNRAELAMFKAQISPHFLFNTLNSLYSLVVGTSRQAEEAFVKFTELLEYTYVTIRNESVAVADEVAYIRNYIDLQAIRLGEHTRVEWLCDVDDPEAQMPPMILMTFPENAFKYGASATHDCTISLALRLHDGLLEFDTCNAVMKRSDEFRRNAPTGIDNCRARLDGVFPGRYSLQAGENDGLYHVNLKIQLNNVFDKK